MVAARRSGKRDPVERFLGENLALGEEAVVRLIFEKSRLRRELGGEADPVEFARRLTWRWWTWPGGPGRRLWPA